MKSSTAIPAVIFGLFFCFILANTALIYLALTTSPGLVEDNYYETGLTFNTTIEERKQISLLGFKVSLSLLGKGSTRRLRFTVLDKKNNAYKEDIKVAVQLYRPSDSSLDALYTVTQKEHLTIPHTFVKSGKWKINYNVFNSQGLIFSGSKRLLIPSSLKFDINPGVQTY
ncbi:MAG: FixH family protein [Nitrospinota bacterium]